MVDEAHSAFDEIPPHVRERIDAGLRGTVFDLLHAEAVKRGDLPPAPRTWFTRLPGRILVLLMQIGLGAVVGSIGVLLAVLLIRKLATAI